MGNVADSGAVISCSSAGQGAKRNGIDLERELEVAVRALAVTPAGPHLLLSAFDATIAALWSLGVRPLASSATLPLHLV